MLDDSSLPSNHGGLIFALDMFRPTMLAAALAEGLIAQVRNINDAKLEIIRHPEIQVVLARVVGSVVGDDPAKFWRENVELGLIASQVVPRQLFLYWMASEPDPRQGFVVAMRGQIVHSAEATADDMPPDATPADWPVAQLLGQMQIGAEELAAGFVGGPRVEIGLMDREGDDRAMLMTLAGQPEEGEAGAEGAPHPGEGGPAQAGQPAAAAAPKRVTVEDDQKRRAAEQQAEQDARQAKADSVRAELPFVLDDLGIVVAPRGAELADTDILSSFLVRAVEGDLPAGIDRNLTNDLQGKRVDFAVPVEFLSEVFSDEGPLTKATFEAQGTQRELGGAEVRVLEVLGPRLGRGSFIRRARAGVFVSRTPDLALPEALIVELLDNQG